MAGRIEEVDAALERVVEVTSTMRLPQAEDGITGAIGALLLWSGRADELAELLKGTQDGPLPVVALHAASAAGSAASTRPGPCCRARPGRPGRRQLVLDAHLGRGGRGRRRAR